MGTGLTVTGLFVTGKITGLAGVLAGDRKANFSRREQLEADMQQVRYHKMREEYDIALRKIDEVLDLDPEFPEALFLKAQIVWEGFGDDVSAVSSLEKLQKIVDDKNSSVQRWAGSFMNEISKEREC